MAIGLPLKQLRQRGSDSGKEVTEDVSRDFQQRGFGSSLPGEGKTHLASAYVVVSPGKATQAKSQLDQHQQRRSHKPHLTPMQIDKKTVDATNKDGPAPNMTAGREPPRNLKPKTGDAQRTLP